MGTAVRKEVPADAVIARGTHYPRYLIPGSGHSRRPGRAAARRTRAGHPRSEEHTSELRSRCNLVCRLLLEKNKKETKKCDGYGFVSAVGLSGSVAASW